MLTVDLLLSLSVVIAILVGMVKCNTADDLDLSIYEGINTTVTITVAWIDKPPYITAATNASLDMDVSELMRDGLLQYIIDCGVFGKVRYDFTNIQVDNESAMIKLLEEGKAHMAAPVFENPSNPRYSEFLFYKVTDYPGTDFITNDVGPDSATYVVLAAVWKSWPLLALTMTATAIAGVFMWVLETYQKTKEFRRSFFKGSWDGVWWSFITITTVGYGDKVPKSTAAQVLCMLWIQLGIINMAIYTANVTSALTALSLNLEPKNLYGKKVALLGNGTEYQHAQEEHAHPKVYNNIDDVINAVKTAHVDGMLLDQYAAAHYKKMGKLQSLVTMKKLDLSRDAGVIFAKENHMLVGCLNLKQSDIWMSVRVIEDDYKLTQQKPAENLSMFDDSSYVIKKTLYLNLGVLAGLLLAGVLWETMCRRKAGPEAATEEMAIPEKTSVCEDLAEGRRLLRQMQEHFDKLEAKVARSLNNA